jgi:hypothetical protein
MPANFSNRGQIQYEFGIEDDFTPSPEDEARFRAEEREMLTPKPGETVEVYRNHDNGDQSTVITDADGNRRGRATFTVVGELRKGTL